MAYTDAELEEMAAKYGQGLSEVDLVDSVGSPGPLAWLLDVVDDGEAFTARAHVENVSPETLVRTAVDAYIHHAA